MCMFTLHHHSCGHKILLSSAPHVWLCEPAADFCMPGWDPVPASCFPLPEDVDNPDKVFRAKRVARKCDDCRVADRRVKSVKTVRNAADCLEEFEQTLIAMEAGLLDPGRDGFDVLDLGIDEGYDSWELSDPEDELEDSDEEADLDPRPLLGGLVDIPGAAIYSSAIPRVMEVGLGPDGQDGVMQVELFEDNPFENPFATPPASPAVVFQDTMMDEHDFQDKNKDEPVSPAFCPWSPFSDPLEPFSPLIQGLHRDGDDFGDSSDDEDDSPLPDDENFDLGLCHIPLPDLEGFTEEEQAMLNEMLEEFDVPLDEDDTQTEQKSDGPEVKRRMDDIKLDSPLPSPGGPLSDDEQFGVQREESPLPSPGGPLSDDEQFGVEREESPLPSPGGPLSDDEQFTVLGRVPPVFPSRGPGLTRPSREIGLGISGAPMPNNAQEAVRVMPNLTPEQRVSGGGGRIRTAQWVERQRQWADYRHMVGQMNTLAKKADLDGPSPDEAAKAHVNPDEPCRLAVFPHEVSCQELNDNFIFCWDTDKVQEYLSRKETGVGMVEEQQNQESAN